MDIVRYMVACALLLFTGCQKQSTITDSPADSEIKNASEEYRAALIGQDSEKLSAMLADDAIYINLTTQETIEGKPAIVQYVTEQFQKAGEPELKFKIDQINFKEPTVAQEKGLVEIVLPGQQSRQYAFKAEYRKENDGWLINKITEISCQAAPSHYEHLKELGWLVGDWENSFDDTVFTASYRWSKNKNFLIQRFSLKVLDYRELSGMQLIGWDPIKKSIRSWMFDSDGGFGTGQWVQDGDSWYVNTVFVLADGRKATATYVYTKQDNSSYIFTSQIRDVDGRILPNIGPFKAVRTAGGSK
jgi:uncharacterized protein (TIGR02246 family)